MHPNDARIAAMYEQQLLGAQMMQAEAARLDQERLAIALRKNGGAVCVSQHYVDYEEAPLREGQLLDALGVAEIRLPVPNGVARPERFPGETRAWGVEDLDKSDRARHDAIRMTDRTMRSPTYSGARFAAGIAIIAVFGVIGGDSINSGGYTAIAFGTAILLAGVIPGWIFRDEARRNIEAGKQRTVVIREAKEKARKAWAAEQRRLVAEDQARYDRERGIYDRAEARRRRRAAATFSAGIRRPLVSQEEQMRNCICGWRRVELHEIKLRGADPFLISPECLEVAEGYVAKWQRS